MNILKHYNGKNPYGLKTDGYPLTLEQTKILFRYFKITQEELADLNEWIKDGNTFYQNPWLIYTNAGSLANYIEGSRFVKDMNEEYFESCVLSITSITDSSFIYEDLPF